MLRSPLLDTRRDYVQYAFIEREISDVSDASIDGPVTLGPISIAYTKGLICNA